MIEKATDQNFDVLVQGDFVLVDFFATWCGPCKMLAPILEEIVKENNIKLVTVDVDESETARKYGIMTVPTLMIFKKGEVITSQTGYMPKDTLEKWIQENTN